MDFKSIALATTVIVLSTSVNAAIITHGSLTTDDTTDFITDTSTGRIYKRFDTFNLSYADTVSAVSVGGIYEGWSIATSKVADDFYAASLGHVSTQCTGATWIGTYCGALSGWSDGDFGESFDEEYDSFWYLSTYETPDTAPALLGAGSISIHPTTLDGIIFDHDDWGDAAFGDSYGGTMYPTWPVNALLYNDSAVVPIPAAIWLFGSGLLGLAGLARRIKS